MFVMASVAAPSILNNARRQREQELIWRGNQYVRGIRLYFQKNGRLPQNKEELLKGTAGVHFVRRAFSDPVAVPNADWRFIYVSPSGQLTGSVRYHTLQEMAAELGRGQNAGNLTNLFGGSSNTQAAQAAGSAGAAGAGRGRSGVAPGAVAGARGGPAGARGGPGAGAGASTGQSQSTGMGLTQAPLQAVDSPVLGASLIGIASKVKKDSLLVYEGEENYFQWEFIWNPLLSPQLGGLQPAQAPAAAPAGAAPAGAAATGAAPFGGTPGSSTTGTGTSSAPPVAQPGVGARPGLGPGRGPVPGMPGGFQGP
jgi:hypothetical protein